MCRTAACVDPTYCTAHCARSSSACRSSACLSLLHHPLQVIFVGLYLATQAVVMALYIRAKSLPPWALALLCFSRRLHSIFLLRLFNDCWAMFVAYVATLALQVNEPGLRWAPGLSTLARIAGAMLVACPRMPRTAENEGHVCAPPLPLPQAGAGPGMELSCSSLPPTP